MDNIISDGFDFPVGKPDAKGYYNAQGFLSTGYKKNPHLGEDWNGVRGGNTDLGDPVYSISNGKVVLCQNVKGWGEIVIIRHKLPDSNEIESMYAHFDAVNVKINDIVSRGQQIGTIGTGDGNYPAHLHFEIRKKNCKSWGIVGPGYSNNHSGWVDPTAYINENRKFHGFSANYDSQAPYPTLIPGGEDATWWIKFKNTGTETWENHNNNNRIIKLALGTYSNPDMEEGSEFNSNWPGTYRLAVLEENSIQPNEVGLFKFNIKVPINKKPGKYKIQITPKTPAGWLKQDNGDELNCFLYVTVKPSEEIMTQSDTTQVQNPLFEKEFSDNSLNVFPTCSIYKPPELNVWSEITNNLSISNDSINSFKANSKNIDKNCYHIRIRIIDEYGLSSGKHIKKLNGLDYQLTFFSDKGYKTVRQGEIANNIISEADIDQQQKVQIKIGSIHNSKFLMLENSISDQNTEVEISLKQPDQNHFETSRSYTYEENVIIKSYYAIIVYPSMGCPAISFKDKSFSLLIASKSDAAPNPLQVNRQLNIFKWTPSQTNKKSYSRQSLYENQDYALKNIEIKEISISDNDTINFSDESNFQAGLQKAIIYNSIKDKLEKNEYKTYFKITLKCSNNNFCLQSGGYQAVWLNPSNENNDLKYEDSMDHFLIKDDLINSHGKKIYNNGSYIPKIKSKSKGSEIIFNDESINLQIFHPIFIIDEKQYLNIGHMSDLHIVNRQCIINKTSVRVIDGDKTSKSMPIGEMVHVAFNSVKNLMDQLGSSKEIDLLIITGDLIDYVRDYYPENHILDTNSGSINKKIVWSECDLSGKVDGDDSHYQMYSSYLVFIALLKDFYVKYKKPVFIVTGNHEVYRDPFGISPRVSYTFGLKRANEGIPADHNLTIYEAILAFGKSYGKIVTSFNFTEKLFIWYYTVICPFTDYVYELINQIFMGLGWGKSEEMISWIDNDDYQGFGHLPRANKSISDNQKKLIEKYTAKSKKKIFFSHFTFVSYDMTIADHDKKEGDIEYDWACDYSEFDMGTFQVNRKVMYEEYIGDVGKYKINIFLSGHSHRRGLYKYKETSRWFDNSIKVKLYQFHGISNINQINKAENKTKLNFNEPVFIVSDSAGSIPKKNYNNEFYSQGSTFPSASIIRFDKNGKYFEVAAIESKATNAKPRFAVSLDYVDIILSKKVIKMFQGSLTSIQQKELEFNIQMIDKKISFIKSISLHNNLFGIWCKIVNNVKLSGNKDVGYFKIDSKKNKYEEFNYDTGKMMTFSNFELFNYIIRNGTKKDLYMEIDFIKRKKDPFGNKIDNFQQQYEHYNYNYSWCFPIKISKWVQQSILLNSWITYFINRSSAEKPGSHKLK